MLKRPRRNRKSKAILSMVAENYISVNDFVYPLFLIDSSQAKEPIPSMPNIFRWGTSSILKEIQECLKIGLNNFAIFHIINDDHKDDFATFSYQEKNFYLETIKVIKKEFPECTIITDVAMDPYSTSGHDGVFTDGKILNDYTLPILAKMAVAQAEAGADIIAPSDMMDGRVEYIRKALDASSFTDVSIMSYTAKYASAFYGPFRDALDSAPKPHTGDKSTYQMNPANAQEALREALLDEEEGADILMGKPGISYLDIITLLKDNTNLPIAVYNVSGEYAMIKAAAEKKWIDEKKTRDEILLSFKRAGASIIVSYFAKDFALDSGLW